MLSSHDCVGLLIELIRSRSFTVKNNICCVLRGIFTYSQPGGTSAGNTHSGCSYGDARIRVLASEFPTKCSECKRTRTADTYVFTDGVRWYYELMKCSHQKMVLGKRKIVSCGRFTASSGQLFRGNACAGMQDRQLRKMKNLKHAAE